MLSMTNRISVKFPKGLEIEVESDTETKVRNLLDDVCEKIMKNSDPNVVAHKISYARQGDVHRDRGNP